MREIVYLIFSFFFVGNIMAMKLKNTDSNNFPTSAEIQLINPFLTRILDAIKAAANIAWNNYKNGK